MIKTKDVDIICSHGDTFDCAWDVEGLTLAGNIVFSIKATPQSTDVLLTTDCSINGKIVLAQFTAEEFSALAVGDYVYDLVMIANGEKKTLLFPANFSVRAVVHNE